MSDLAQVLAELLANISSGRTVLHVKAKFKENCEEEEMELKATFSLVTAPAQGGGGLVLTVDGTIAQPSPAPNPLPDDVVGTPDVITIGITGGMPPYNVSISSGALPDGLALGPSPDGQSVQISGTPTTAGTATFELDVTDSSAPILAKRVKFGK